MEITYKINKITVKDDGNIIFDVDFNGQKILQYSGIQQIRNAMVWDVPEDLLLLFALKYIFPALSEADLRSLQTPTNLKVTL